MADSEQKLRGRSKNSRKHKGNSLQSPYSKPISKTRSASNSKNQSSSKTSILLTASSKNLFQDTFPITHEKKSSFKNSLSDLRSDSTDDLYSKLLKELKHAKSSEEEFEIHQKYFTELIKSDKKYSRVLNRIKIAYETRLQSSDSGVVAKLRTDLKDLQAQANKDYRDKQLYTKKIEKLAKENVELSRTLDDTEEKYNSMVTRLQEISKYDLQKVPKDEITWKALAMENQALVQVNKEMQHDLKMISAKEKKLISLLLELKRLGYPVEEIYEQRNSKTTKDSPGSYVEDTDNEALVSGRAKSVAKPKCIPALKLKELPKEDSFSSDY